MSNKVFSIFLTVVLWSASTAVPVHAGGAYEPAAPTGSAATPDSTDSNGNGSTKYHDFDLSDHTKSSAGVRSLLVPGWGQAFNGQEKKGALYFGVTSILVVSTILSYNAAQHSYNDYEGSGRVNDSSYDDYTNQLNLTWALGTLSAIMWGVGVYDAVRNSAGPQQTQTTTTLAFDDRGNPRIVYARRF